MDRQTDARSSRGIYVVISIFVFGGLALAGLFLAPRGKVPATQPATMPTTSTNLN